MIEVNFGEVACVTSAGKVIARSKPVAKSDVSALNARRTPVKRPRPKCQTSVQAFREVTSHARSAYTTPVSARIRSHGLEGRLAAVASCGHLGECDTLTER